MDTSRDAQEKAMWGHFALNLALASLPVTLVWAFMLDEFDRKLRGKAPYARQYSTRLGAYKNFQALVEDVDRTGQLGLIGSMMHMALNWTDPKMGVGRGVAMERIFVASMLDNFVTSVRRTWLQGGVDWQTVTRGTPGMSGAIQFLQIANKLGTDLGLPPISPTEFAVTRKLNAKRYLQAAGEQLGLEVRAPIQGMPTEQSYYTSLMLRAAMEDNREDFREFYVEALRRSKEFYDEEDKAVRRSWRSRHPLNNVFRSKPNDKELRRLFSIMPSGGRESVQDAMRLFDKYDKLITSYER